MHRRLLVPLLTVALIVPALSVLTAAASATPSSVRGTGGTAGTAGTASTGAGAFRDRLIREGRVSGVVRPEGMRLAQEVGRAPAATCTTPGDTNYMADCASQGWPTNETTLASNGSMFVAGANDYNSYNVHAQLGFYWSTNGRTWNDAGVLDFYPHDPDNGAGDPGLAIDANGVVYYSNIFFSYTDATVGGVELARRDPSTGAWTYHQIADNTASTFQDKPAIVISGTHVFECWTFFAAGSTIQVAQFKLGAASRAPQKVFEVPGTGNSQGCSMAADGHGGIWIAWEEGQSIRIGHWLRGFWTSLKRVSPDSFRDLPGQFPGFRFRLDSFPFVAVVNGSPYVVWASSDTGIGRTYLYAHGAVHAVSDTGGQQFFASIGASPQGYAISWSQTGPKHTYAQYMWFAGSVTKISTDRSKPNQDCRFDPRGSFIGDYNTTLMNGATPMPIWTDIRRKSQACHGLAQDTMVYVP
jgi:hypothetical protein